MDARGPQRKSASKEKMNKGFIAEDDIDNDMMEEEEEDFLSSEGFADDDKKKKMIGKKGSGGVGVVPPYCQVERCGAILTDAKRYHKRHKVCEVHAKAPVVIVAGLRQRFCQQCSRSWFLHTSCFFSIVAALYIGLCCQAMLSVPFTSLS